MRMLGQEVEDASDDPTFSAYYSAGSAAIQDRAEEQQQLSAALTRDDAAQAEYDQLRESSGAADATNGGRVLAACDAALVSCGAARDAAVDAKDAEADRAARWRDAHDAQRLRAEASRAPASEYQVHTERQDAIIAALRTTKPERHVRLPYCTGAAATVPEGQRLEIAVDVGVRARIGRRTTAGAEYRAQTDVALPGRYPWLVIRRFGR